MQFQLNKKTQPFILNLTKIWNLRLIVIQEILYVPITDFYNISSASLHYLVKLENQKNANISTVSTEKTVAMFQSVAFYHCGLFYQPLW